MADAISSFKLALSSYRKNVVDYAIYSVLFSGISAVLGVIVVVAFLVFGIVAAGSFVSLVASGNFLSLDGVGTAVMLLLMLAGLFIFTLLQGGLLGAYLETVDGLLSDRKQTLGGFISAIPRQSGRMLLAGIATFIVIAIPAAAGLAGAYFLGFASIPGLAVAILGVFLAYLLSLLFIFVPPAVAVGKRGAIDAMKSSLVHIAKNPVAFVIFLVIYAVLSLPSVTFIYAPLVFLPVGQAALLAFYRH